MKFVFTCKHDAGCCAGSCRPVRRQEYPPDSAPAVGVSWEWEGDVSGQWHSYSTDVASLLEKGHLCGASVVDLNRHPFSLPYTVRLSSMVQIRHGSHYKRHVQRVMLLQRYMPTSSNFSQTAVVSPFSVPVFQPANATSHGSSGPSIATFPIPGTSQVSPGSLFFPSLFTSSLSSSFPPPLSSGPAVGPLWGSGLHGGSSTSAVVNSSPFVGGSNISGQKPLFTIGRSPPSGGVTRRKRALAPVCR